MKLKVLLTLGLLLGIFANSSAVTDGEMEQARAITAKNYLRWVNNGSGYLDDIKDLPKSMADLKKILKPKELENLKKFEAVRTPKDYASWDKTKLVAYWSETFLSSPALDPAGKGSHKRTASHLAKMTVSAPAPETAKPEAAPTPEVSQEQTPTPSQSEATEDSISSYLNTETGLSATDEITETVAQEAEDEDALRPKKSNATWIYIGILIFLVVVVIILVIYAARAMKGEKGSRDDSDELGGPEPGRGSGDDSPTYVPGDSVTRKEHDFMIERKNEKIRKVKAELDVLREENARLQASHDALQTRLSQAQTQIESLRLALSEAKKAPNPSSSATSSNEPSPRPATRSLYLGRVNKDGLFVRADRQLNPDSTVYRLDTEDGYTGSFRVVNTPVVVDRVVGNPLQWLDGGCTASDLLEPDEASEIITESSGTAILENGCWKMIRKAKIKYS